jgi:hypothetical protein
MSDVLHQATISTVNNIVIWKNADVWKPGDSLVKEKANLVASGKFTYGTRVTCTCGYEYDLAYDCYDNHELRGLVYALGHTQMHLLEFIKQRFSL